jgi:hypothetical protein
MNTKRLAVILFPGFLRYRACGTEGTKVQKEGISDLCHVNSLGLIPGAEFGELLDGPELVGHSDSTNLRRDLVGLAEPRLLTDFACRCQKGPWSTHCEIFDGLDYDVPRMVPGPSVSWFEDWRSFGQSRESPEPTERSSHHGFGLLLFDAPDAKLLDVLQSKSRNGFEHVLAVATRSEALSGGAVWELLQAGAADVFAWHAMPDTAAMDRRPEQVAICRTRLHHGLAGALRQRVLRA